MSEKAQYRTRQITELENYLCSMEGKHVTVSDICKYFKKCRGFLSEPQRCTASLTGWWSRDWLPNMW